MTCSWLTIDLFTSCSCLVHLVFDLLMICSCLVHDLFITCSWLSSLKLSITYSCFVNNLFMFWSKLFMNYASCACLVWDLNRTCPGHVHYLLLFITYSCFINNLTTILSWLAQSYIWIIHSFLCLVHDYSQHVQNIFTICSCRTTLYTSLSA